MSPTCSPSRNALQVVRNVIILIGILGGTRLRGAIVTFDFTGTIFNTFGVPNAGSNVSGYYSFDPGVANSSGLEHLGNYTESAPAEFHLQTNAGFSLTQTTTFIQISDKYEDGIVDSYRVDADAGSFGDNTQFDRLEVALSDNANPIIENILIPTVPPDFSLFQFQSVNFFEFDGNTETKLIQANFTSLTPAPEPGGLPLLAGGVFGLFCARRGRKQAT
jgi:hypothetical protein